MVALLTGGFIAGLTLQVADDDGENAHEKVIWLV
jgi:hypothetical protein